ncbi:MAG: glycosyltransferase family 2 protein [Magnetococcales bacterium]|nr:glycosyltransferase family 2 protein [Magnetococcales bacterium]
MSHVLSYVVPTKDHPDDLLKMLSSLTNQTRLPDQVVVVDGSEPPVHWICEQFTELPLTYVREFPPSLARQRNAGMAAVRADATLAGYLDDDLVLEPEATEKLLAFFEAAPAEVGGAAMTIINQGQVGRAGLLRFFGMYGDPPGRVLPSGFPVWIPFTEVTLQTEWLYGGATIWRREVIREFSYDEWYIGYGFLEDLDYSYRVSRKYRLYVLGDSRTWHFSQLPHPSRQFALGRQQVVNRLYFVRKMGGFSRLAVAWALLGQMTMNLLAGLVNPKAKGYMRFLGNLAGLGAVAMGRKSSFGGHWKK